jgi:hypothetical protein
VDSAQLAARAGGSQQLNARVQNDLKARKHQFGDQ